MSQPQGTDGMLQEWGTRLFYGMPSKPKKTGGNIAVGIMAVASLLSAEAVRARVRAALRPRAKEVMVKITGGGRGMKAIAAHIRYISRQGKAEVGGRGQSLGLEDENGSLINGKKDLEGLQHDWQMAGSYIPEESRRREAFNIILSMPSATPADVVRDAARAFARETFEGHKYVFVLHADTAQPHVHLAVRAERMDGARLNPRKADLRRWRERFAERLQDRGIHAVATRVAMRGVSLAPQELWRIRAGDEGRVRATRQAVRSAGSMQRARSQALEAWGHLARALARSAAKDDRDLASEVVRYVGQHFGKGGLDQGREPSQRCSDPDPTWRLR